MRISENRSVGKLVTRLSSDNDVSLKNQERADLLRSRIEELKLQFARLNVEWARMAQAFREGGQDGP